MRKNYGVTIITCLILVLSIGTIQCSKSQPGDTPEQKESIALETDQEKASYVVGYNIGLQILRTIAGEVNLDIVVRGMMDAALERDALIPETEMQEILTRFSNRVNEQMAQERRDLGEKNRLEGEAFLKENAGKAGIKSTESGLQYQIIREGSGKKPKPEDRVRVHYRGTFLNGEEFDSSYSRGEPATFRLEGVIEGWKEALQLMRVGAKFKLFVPADLAYKESGNQVIPPNSVLIFEVELLDINPEE